MKKRERQLSSYGRRTHPNGDPVSINTLLNLEGPIDEIDALACLLGMARRLDDRDRYGYDLEFLDEIVIRRIRKLARVCQDAHARWANPLKGDDPPDMRDLDDAP